MLTLLFLSVDGHLVLVDMVVQSYDALPPGAAWLGARPAARTSRLFGGYAFLAGLLLALPVGFLLLCLNLVVGMLVALAPALNLFAVGLPASLAVGVVALAIALPGDGRLHARHRPRGPRRRAEPGARLMAEEFGEKTEAPTPKRRKKAVDEGRHPQVAASSRTALVVLAGVALAGAVRARR